MSVMYWPERTDMAPSECGGCLYRGRFLCFVLGSLARHLLRAVLVVGTYPVTARYRFFGIWFWNGAKLVPLSL